MISNSIIKNVTIKMIHHNNLAKLFPSPRTAKMGDLLNPSGGVATHAYFLYQHIHYQNQDKSSSNLLPLQQQVKIHTSSIQNNGGPDKERDSSANDDIKSKLEALKEKLAQNAYYAKYKEKFQQLELTRPRELLAKLENIDARHSGGVSKQQKSSTAQQNSRSRDHFLLKDVMDLNRIKDLERDDIIFLWQEFHRKKEGLLAAVMSGSVFEKMADLASLYPIFLLPLPRANGYEFLYVQFLNNAFHFTPLLAYQTHKQNAPECFRLIAYTDLQTSKDLVLMRGEFDKNSMTTKDAHIISVQINFYYGETSDSRKKLLELFSRQPDTFEYMDLIEELKKLQQSHSHLFEFDDN